MKKKNLKHLALNKKPISNLSLQEMNEVQGKGILSIGANCSRWGNCDSVDITKGLFCPIVIRSANAPCSVHSEAGLC